MKIIFYTTGIGDQTLEEMVDEINCLEIEVDNSKFRLEPLAEGFRVQTEDNRPMFIWPEGKDDIGIFTAFETEH